MTLTATDIVTRTSPTVFTEIDLGLALYPWQRKALTALELATGPSGRVTQIAVASPNEGGKSSRIVAPAALWWITLHKKGKAAITTKDAKQLNEQIIPAIEAHLAKFSGYHSVRSPYYKLTTPHGATIIAYTTDDAGRVEGLHSDGPDAPLLWIVDEAKSVQEPIFQGIDRCGYRALLYASSPGIKQGAFYDAFTRNRNQFYCITAGLKDCPHIAPEKIQRIIDKYGEAHPFTRSSVFGEFMSQDDENQFAVPIDYVERALRNPPSHHPGMKVAFCDFGGGTSEHVIALRDGNRISILAAWREAHKEAAANRFIREFKKAGLKPEQIFADASDKELADLLSGAGWQINRQNFGAPSSLTEEYISWGAEAWIEAGIQIGKCELILPDDDELKAQLTTRKKGIGNRGKQTIEEKYEMSKRNLPSPDRADAVVGVIAVYDPNYAIKQPFQIPSGIFSEGIYTDQEDSRQFVESMGACVGS